MMKSSMVFVVGHRPPYVHLASTRRHSRDKCSQAFPVFRALLPPCIILNANRRTKNGVGLGTRLLKAWVGLGQPGSARAPPIIVTRAVFNVRMSCDASVT